MFKDNLTFYPTPNGLINKMKSLIEGNPLKALEPSAGKGDIIEKINDDNRGSYGRRMDWSAIEIDKDLRATLRGKGIKVIDTNFLSYSGPDKFDLIIANPPFDHGGKHLLKAIDIMYRGQIIFLLNAETLRNPHTNSRKELAKKLRELDANIEYITGAFKNSERPTGVEVALINIVIKREVEDDLFAGADDEISKEKPQAKEFFELTTGRHIEEMVLDYNNVVKIGTETILGYFRNFKKIGAYIGLNKEANKYDGDGDMTSKMQEHLNTLLKDVRTNFWRKTLDLKEVQSRLTEKKQKEFEYRLTDRCNMDFTENNIRAFVLNLINGYQDDIRESVMGLFDKLTIQHSYHGGAMEKNIHYFNGWKTNDAFKVNKKVIIPFYSGSSFIDYSGGWKLDYSVARELRDIDIVMNYFDGMSPHYRSIAAALTNVFSHGINQGNSTYFSKIIAHKKGTIHLTFRDEDILRRFNVEACKGKKWLPENYGAEKYHELGYEEKEVVDSFEGKKSYDDNLGRKGLDCTGGHIAITEGKPEQTNLW